MNSDDFIRLLESYHPEKIAFSGDQKKLLNSVLKERSYPKNHILLYEQQVPTYAWFIIKGTARVYYFDQYLQREVTSWFWFKGDMMFSMNSFFRQLEAGESIELLEDSTLLLLSFADIGALRVQYRECLLLERTLIEDYYSRFNRHHRNMLAQRNEDKYRSINMAHKELFNLANQKDIASFLKMHPKSLSYLRLHSK